MWREILDADVEFEQWLVRFTNCCDTNIGNTGAVTRTIISNTQLLQQKCISLIESNTVNFPL